MGLATIFTLVQGLVRRRALAERKRPSWRPTLERLEGRT